MSTTKKNIYKIQYTQELKNYDFIGLLDSIQKFNEFYTDKLTIRERINIWNNLFN